MRSRTPRYPVDRYLVESSKNIEMVNIIDDDLWNPEPALRPEDEIILRKLHEMLQSTACDLKLLSGELSKFHEPGVQVKTAPTPLDDEFNEKVHIEEVVNAKFHGHKIINNPSLHQLKLQPLKDVVTAIKPSKNINKSKNINNKIQDDSAPIIKKTLIKNLGISRTRVIQINENNIDSKKNEKLNNDKVSNNAPAIAYNEFSYKYIEPKHDTTLFKPLQVQVMPSINIRSELKEQKVLHLDITPENDDNKEINTNKSNIAVVAIKHESVPKQLLTRNEEPVQHTKQFFMKPVRKISKMSTCESSGSTNNISSDAQVKLKTQERIINTIRNSPQASARIDRSKKNVANKTGPEKRSHLNLDEWKKKLNMVYGPSTSKNIKVPPKYKSKTKKVSPKKSNSAIKLNRLNNAEYIPYSQLTLGGVRVSDIEREISDIPNKDDILLSPILDKILSSRENSFSKTSPRRSKQRDGPKILTTSDENLLQEVIDIERTVSETLSKNLTKPIKASSLKSKNVSSDSDDNTGKNESYADDFEEERSGNTENPKNNSDSEKNISHKSSCKNMREDSDNNGNDNDEHKVLNTTFPKTTNLSFKKSVDIFEFVHSIDTQDTATQSNTTNKISPKETQTSPRNDKSNIQPIHNDLWPSPRGEVEKMFKIEKDFIKKLILDEYGDLLEKNVAKPSTSKECKDDSDRNVIASQKNTQTSPAHVKSVMTSPTRTKTRTTSPMALPLPVDHHTSPMMLINEEEVKFHDEDISINLSSPRFSLRLPQNSREVLSNLGACSRSQSQINLKTVRKPTDLPSSSSSIDADNSSSDLSSLGEIKQKLKKRLSKNKISSISGSSTSSTISIVSSDLRSSGILPLKSDGEISLGLITKRK